MEKLNKILKNFSFSQAESELYAAALKLNKAGISEIAEKAGIGRTVAYFHIKNLLKKNVLRQSKSGKKIIISPINPSELAQNLQESVGDFKSLIPQLESLNKIENEIPEIKIQESNTAFKEIYDEVIHMPIGSELKVLEDQAGARAELNLLDNEYWTYFFNQMAAQQIVTKAIFTKEVLADTNKSMTPSNYAILQSRLWNVRTLPDKDMPLKGLVIMYNKKISFLFPDVALTITIKHHALHNLIDTMFETIFLFAEKVDDPWGKPVTNKDVSPNQTPQKATEEDIYY